MPTFCSVTSELFLHEDWNLENPGLWREAHPWGEIYGGASAGFRKATAERLEWLVGSLSDIAMHGKEAREGESLACSLNASSGGSTSSST